MNCMKCGRETKNDQVFCQDCLLEMEKYPVLPGSVVLLPRRRESTVIKKTPKRHVLTAEEQIASLRKWVITLMIIVGACIAVIALMIKPTLHYILDEHVEVGQNYSSVTSTVAQTVPEEQP